MARKVDPTFAVGLQFNADPVPPNAIKQHGLCNLQHALEKLNTTKTGTARLVGLDYDPSVMPLDGKDFHRRYLKMLKGITTTLLAVAALLCCGADAQAQNPIARNFNHFNHDMFGGSNCGRAITNAQAAGLWSNYCHEDCSINSNLSGGGGCHSGLCGSGSDVTWDGGYPAGPVAYGGGYSVAPGYGSFSGGSACGGSGCGGSGCGGSGCGCKSGGHGKIKRMIARVFGSHGCCGCGKSYFDNGSGNAAFGSSTGFSQSYLGYGGGSGGGCGSHGGCCLHGKKGKRHRGCCGGGGGSYSSGYANYAPTSYASAGYASTGYASTGYASTGYSDYSSVCNSRRCCKGKHRRAKGRRCHHGGCSLFSGGGVHDRMFSNFYAANSSSPGYFASYVGSETGFSDFNSSVNGSIMSACGCSSCGGGGAALNQSYYAPQPTAGNYMQPTAIPMANGYSN